MKFCPTCRTQYTDDTLRFCLQDGAILVERAEFDTPTMALPETPTVVAEHRRSQATVIRDVGLPNTFAGSGTERKQGVAIPVIVTAAVMLLLSGVAFVAFWAYMSGGRVEQPRDVASNSANAVVDRSPKPAANFPTSVKTPVPSPTENSAAPTNDAAIEPTQSADKERITRAVSRTVENWKDLAQARDLNAYMNNYAERIDYYRKSGASRSFVRADKARAFGIYDSISIELSNLQVSVRDDGSRATAAFDKEWAFRGAKNSFGKVRSQLEFANAGGRWLIISERDLRVYYTR